MIGLELILFIFIIGLVGLATHTLFFQNCSPENSGLLELFLLRFLSGIATISIVLLIAIFTGLLFKAVLLSAQVFLLLLFAIQWHKKRISGPVRLLPYMIFCFCVGLGSYGIATFTKPYQALVSAHDATIYIGSAFQMADFGGFHYQDSLVLELSGEERELFFSRVDGIHSRFRGGVRLRDIEKGVVSFGFLPLFPAWLALGILFLGAQGFLNLLSFFTVLGILLLYLIGKRLSGPLLGISLAIVLFFFFPQFYFSRLPLSECFAQALFLCGLFIFTSGSSIGHQRLTGILWGSMFLCRIDLMFFSLIFLILLFTLHPDYRAKWKDWRVFILTISGFALCTFYWQLTTGTYLHIWGLNNQPLAKMVWLPTVVFLYDFLKTYPLLGNLSYLILSSIMLALLRLFLKKQLNLHYERWIRFAGAGFAFMLILSLIGTHLDGKKLWTHASWVLIYIPPFVIAVLMAGYFFLFLKRVRQSNTGLVLTLLILLILPALFFVTRPLITQQQPLFVRRFVPAVYPLFFLLSLYGWFRFLQIFVRPALLSRAVFFSLVLCLTWFFYTDTAYLIRKPLFADVIPQVMKLAERIPQDALVIIPRKDVGIHMELPLQYMMKRDTISVPDERFRNLFDSFLQRQISKSRPIFLLSTRHPDSNVGILPNFLIEPEFSERVLVYKLAPTKAEKVPFRGSTGVLRYRGYRILSPVLTENENHEAESSGGAILAGPG